MKQTNGKDFQKKLMNLSWKQYSDALATTNWESLIKIDKADKTVYKMTDYDKIKYTQISFNPAYIMKCSLCTMKKPAQVRIITINCNRKIYMIMMGTEKLHYYTKLSTSYSYQSFHGLVQIIS